MVVDFEEQRMWLEEEHKASSASVIETLTTANSKEVVKLKKLIQDLESALMLEKSKTEGKKGNSIIINETLILCVQRSF